jgi:hypothetical protein
VGSVDFHWRLDWQPTTQICLMPKLRMRGDNLQSLTCLQVCKRTNWPLNLNIWKILDRHSIRVIVYVYISYFFIGLRYTEGKYEFCN